MACSKLVSKILRQAPYNAKFLIKYAESIYDIKVTIIELNKINFLLSAIIKIVVIIVEKAKIKYAIRIGVKKGK